MLTLALPTNIYLCLTPMDMRKSFDTLAAIVRDGLQHDPMNGSLFVFRSRRHDRIKLLYWDQDGYAIWMKRLEHGTFQFPESSTLWNRAESWRRKPNVIPDSGQLPDDSLKRASSTGRHPSSEYLRQIRLLHSR